MMNFRNGTKNREIGNEFYIYLVLSIYFTVFCLPHTALHSYTQYLVCGILGWVMCKIRLETYQTFYGILLLEDEQHTMERFWKTSLFRFCSIFNGVQILYMCLRLHSKTKRTKICVVAYFLSIQSRIWTAFLECASAHN